MRRKDTPLVREIQRARPPRKIDCQLGAACICRKSGWKGSGCLAEDKEIKAVA